MRSGRALETYSFTPAWLPKPVTPTNCGWSSGNTPLPRGEHITAAPVRSATAAISRAARRAPKPAQIAKSRPRSRAAQSSTKRGFRNSPGSNARQRERRAVAGLHRERQRQVADPALRAREPARERRGDRGQLGGIADPPGVVEDLAALEQAGGGQGRVAGLLERAPAHLARGGAGRDQEHAAALPARGAHAGEGVGHAGTGRHEDQRGEARGERVLERREGRAGLVPAVHRLDAGAPELVAERRDRPAGQPVRAAHAERFEQADHRRRDRPHASSGR